MKQFFYVILFAENGQITGRAITTSEQQARLLGHCSEISEMGEEEVKALLTEEELGFLHEEGFCFLRNEHGKFNSTSVANG